MHRLVLANVPYMSKSIASQTRPEFKYRLAYMNLFLIFRLFLIVMIYLRWAWKLATEGETVMIAFVSMLLPGISWSTIYAMNNYFGMHDTAINTLIVFNLFVPVVNALYLDTDVLILTTTPFTILIGFVVLPVEELNYSLLNFFCAIGIYLLRKFYVESFNITVIVPLYNEKTAYLFLCCVFFIGLTTLCVGHKFWASEVELKEMIEKLREEVKRSNEISLKLKGQQEKTEEALQARTLLLSNVSHEIRTPLAAVMSLCTLIRETMLSDLQSSYIQVIDRTANVLLVLLKDLLDSSRLELGAVNVIYEKIRLVDCLYSMITVASLSASEKGLELCFSVSPELESRGIYSHEESLQSIVFHLLTNSIKFTDGGASQLVTLRASLVSPDYYFVANKYLNPSFRLKDRFPEIAQGIFSSFLSIN